MTAVAVYEDRSLVVKPGEHVRTAWIDIDLCSMACRAVMQPATVAAKFQRLLCLGENSAWPPIVGEWCDERFSILDGRHEFLASLMLGRTKIFVAWLVPAAKATTPSLAEFRADALVEVAPWR
jgi:hypothetical protein